MGAALKTLISKEKLSDYLLNVNNNYILGLAAHSLFENKRVYALLAGSKYMLGAEEIDFENVGKWLRNPLLHDIYTKEFAKMCLRTVINEMYELVCGYCEETGQLQLARGEPWFQYARLLRNAASHSGYFKFSRREKNTLLPVTWRGKTITEALHGKYANLGLFGFEDARIMYMEASAFVDQKLT